MGSPKIEYDIQDVYSITQTNQVGAENRGNVELSSANEVVINTMPITLGGLSCTNLQEIIQYASDNSKDLISIDMDYTFQEHNLNLPASITIQAKNGHNVVIEMVDVMKTRRLNGDITTSITSGASKTNQIMTATSGNTVVYYNTTFKRYDTSSYGAIGTILAMTYDEWMLVNNSGTYKLFQGNTEKATITGADTTNPQILFTNLLNDYIYIKSTTAETIKRYNITLNSQDTVTVKKLDGNNFTTLENWYVQTSYPPFTSVKKNNMLYGLGYGLVDNVKTTYLYSDTSFASTSIIKTINAKMLTIASNYAYTFHFVGGEQIWSYDGKNWVFEHNLDFTPNYAKFYLLLNTNYDIKDVFYVATNTSQNKTVIFRRDMKTGSWLETKNYNQALIPLGSLTEWYSGGVLHILLRNYSDNKLYDLNNKTFQLGDSSRLHGLVIKNVLTSANRNDIVSADSSSSTMGLVNGTTNTTKNSKLTYCSIYANTLHATYQIFDISNSILTTDKKAIYQEDVTNATINTSTQYNLIIAGDDAVNISKFDTETITTTYTFTHNTVVSLNGIMFNNLTNYINTFTYNILNCSNIATKLYTTSQNYQNNVLNGRMLYNDLDVDETVSPFSGLQTTRNKNPLFISPSTNNYKLMTKAEGYPLNSVAYNITGGTDAGCYTFTRTNNGETNKKTLTLSSYVIDIPESFEYPNKESGFTLNSQYDKVMGDPVRVLTLQRLQTNMTLADIRLLEYLHSKDDIFKFYPNGSDNIYFYYELSGTDKTYKNTLIASASVNDNTITISSPYYFEPGRLRGAIVKVGSGPYFYYYIEDNTSDTLYLRENDDYAFISSSILPISVSFYFVRMSDTINYENSLNWVYKNQSGISPEIKLYAMEWKS